MTPISPDTDFPEIATGVGHYSVIHAPATDDYYAVYHRRSLGKTDANANANARVTCINRQDL